MRIPAPIVRTALHLTAGWLTPDALPIGLQRTGLELAMSLPPGPQVADSCEGGVSGERHRHRAGHTRALLYLHGGGYCIGSPRTHRRVVAHLARALEAEAFVPAYRLAPEHPYPAGLADTVTAYVSLSERFEEVVVAGDSAGGGLTLALAIHARDHRLRQPTALGLICPWLDLVGPHQDTGDPLITSARLEYWKNAYASSSQTQPEVSPVMADLNGLAPIVLHSAGDDPLLADAEKLAERIKVEHRRHPGTFHAFHALAGVLNEADEALDALAVSLRLHVANRSSMSIAA